MLPPTTGSSIPGRPGSTAIVGPTGETLVEEGRLVRVVVGVAMGELKVDELSIVDVVVGDGRNVVLGVGVGVRLGGIVDTSGSIITTAAHRVSEFLRNISAGH